MFANKRLGVMRRSGRMAWRFFLRLSGSNCACHSFPGEIECEMCRDEPSSAPFVPDYRPSLVVCAHARARV